MELNELWKKYQVKRNEWEIMILNIKRNEYNEIKRIPRNEFNRMNLIKSNGTRWNERNMKWNKMNETRWILWNEFLNIKRNEFNEIKRIPRNEMKRTYWKKWIPRMNLTKWKKITQMNELLNRISIDRI
jgi:hypothetical protein